MAKLYKFNMRKNQHNIELALMILGGRERDAIEAGEHEAAYRAKERWNRLYDAYERVGFYAGGMAECEWADWQILKDASDWARSCRMDACERVGVEYAE